MGEISAELSPITNKEEAIRWVEELTAKARHARVACNISFPESQEKTADHQRKSYQQFLVRHGSAMGALVSMLRAGLIDALAYQQLRQQNLNMLLPTNVRANVSDS